MAVTHGGGRCLPRGGLEARERGRDWISILPFKGMPHRHDLTSFHKAPLLPIALQAWDKIFNTWIYGVGAHKP